MISHKIKKYIENILLIDEIKVGDFPQARVENFNTCNFIGIDLDKVTDKIYKKYYTNKPKSCDVLKLFDARVDFIEIKTLDISEVKTLGSKIGKKYELIKKLEASYDLLKEIIENEKDFDNKIDLDLLIEIQKLFCIAFYFKYSIDKDNGEQFAISGRVNIFKKNLESYFRDNLVPYGENFIDDPKLLSVNFVSNNIEMVNDFYK
ncbi:hypothetical protein HGA92_00160 [Candidatus Gracilibacteria bacterium]|nr:hypothetical protein [Candidatus Gracilibacteria bacterium]NUJ98975.1 hypothetical protein [Candidatus Gracilibacteria bacterium]